MDANFILKSIIQHLQQEKALAFLNGAIFNYVPPEKSPPYIAVQIKEYRQGLGHKTASADVIIHISSLYQGDAELESISELILNVLSNQTFKDIEGRFIFQGKLKNRTRKVSADGRTRREEIDLTFFISI